jgi:ADP-dependent NAD(P)H-hydrate dehydratase
MKVTEITREFLLAHPLPKPERSGDKQARGRVLVIAGSVEIPGAALLAGLGSLRAGAGVLQIATCRSQAGHLGMAIPEAMIVGCDETQAGGIDPASAPRLIELGAECDAVLIGPGMTDPGGVAELTGSLLNELDRPALVLDAVAFSTLRADAVRRGRTGKIVVTPHSGEMAKFLDAHREDVDGDALNAARKAAAVLPAVVAMKGAETYVVSEDGDALLSRNGSIGLATSGSGDTLAGILVGLLARGTQPVLATAWAVYMHGQAGRDLVKKHGEFGFLAREIPAEIPRIMMDLRAEHSAG